MDDRRQTVMPLSIITATPPSRATIDKAQLVEAAEPPKVGISVEDLTFYYGAAIALKSVSFPIFENKVTSLIGPSGCGKSTLIRTLNRIYSLYPDQYATGKVMFEGRNLLDPDIDLNESRARIGMVFQKPAPFPMTIYENVAFGIRLFERLSRAEIGDRVEVALRRAALWDEVRDRLHDSALRLSGGQQQRLCIARTLAVRPEVILLDEPAASLDPISTAKIEVLIEELKSDHTVVIVTHNLQQAVRISDYTAFMYLGNLIEFGATEQIFTAPAHETTERYITGRFG